MSSDENKTPEIPEEKKPISYDEEIAQLRDAVQSMREELDQERAANEALRAENRKYFYNSVKTGLPDTPPEPEPEKILTPEELANNLGEIIKNRR